MQKSVAKRMSVQAKINLTLVAVFALVMVSLISYSAWSERELVTHVVERQTQDAADAYFDSINTMMLTGTMGQREILRQKILERPGVIEARIIRAKGIIDVFGAGNPEQAPVDELDHRALADEPVMQVTEGEEGRVLTVINPIHASKDYRGTNCLLCHQVPENSVVGAVRVSYSLRALDEQVNANIFASAGIQLGLFIAGLLMMVYTLRRLVIKPLNRVRATMEAIEQDADLSRHIEVTSGDEIGAVAAALNAMLSRFRSSLQEVHSATRQLATGAERLANVSEETVKAIYEQRSQTDQVATAMNEMSAAVQEVAQNANSAADASHHADQEARNGALVATEALGGIDALMNEVEGAAQVIARLEDESTNIGVVLDVIKDIAEQTNLLALNAAIEAARAGEQGRGFAVVADEVRTLASRTQKSTEEIHAMIQRLQGGARDAVQVMDGARKRAEAGSEQVEAAAESLGAIAGEVHNISDRNTQIATAAEEQSSVAEEINRNIVTISELADMTSEGARQTSAVGEELVQLAGTLESLVGRFKL